MWIHKHMEEGHRVCYTDGANYDCPPSRACWIEVSDKMGEWSLKHLGPNREDEDVRIRS